MEHFIEIRLSMPRMLWVACFLGLPCVLLAAVAAIGVLEGCGVCLLIAAAALPAAVFCTAMWVSIVAFGIFCALRAWRAGYRIWIDAGTTLRDTDGRVAHLDGTQLITYFGKAPFEVCVLRGTAAEGWQAPIRTRARTFGFGPAMVLQAMSRGDLVLPLLFIRNRASIRRLLRRCVVVAP